MLGRFVRDKYESQRYELVSQEVKDVMRHSDLVVANMESPITDEVSPNTLAFAGSKQLLDEVKEVGVFSLSNNHINDFGDKGISDTIENLQNHKFVTNGIFKESYEPYTTEQDGQKIAIVTCTDMMNYELGEDSPYQILRVDSPEVNETIRRYKEKGFFVILFSHCGSLFCRFPNPQIRGLLYSAVDSGAGCVVTCHSHCLGGMDKYKGVPIFYSLGDFLMDGGSYRRRRSCLLSLTIEDNELKEWNVIPTVTSKEQQVVIPADKERKKMMHDYEEVSKKMQEEHQSYENFYKYQYKKEMLNHSLSTLCFLYDTKGLLGFMKMLKVRYYAVYRMIHRMIFDRSKMRYDADGIDTKHLLKNDKIR